MTHQIIKQKMYDREVMLFQNDQLEVCGLNYVQGSYADGPGFDEPDPFLFKLYEALDGRGLARLHRIDLSIEMEQLVTYNDQAVNK